MKQKTIATRHLRTKIAAGYVLILFVIFGIVYIWLNEQNRQQELEATTYKIRSLRKDVHEVYMKVVDLSMIGETVLDWNEEDMAAYHEKRLEVDSLLSRFKSRTCRSERIDSICQLLAEKEKLLNRIMLVLYEQEEIKEKIARQVPAIALKSSQEEPKKRKRTGFLGLFGEKGRSETDRNNHHAQYAEQRYDSPPERTKRKVEPIHRQPFGKKQKTELPTTGND